jgi:hypothetical protein
MVRIIGLEIPQGLEDFFWEVVFGIQGKQTFTIGMKRQLDSRIRTYKIIERSLFVKWQSLYNSFTSTRRHNWDEYWATLPFGSLGGPDYWPGSGYSAFVYVNAPRYKAGLDLILDAPLYPELVYNGNFDVDLSGWVLLNSVTFDNGKAYHIGYSYPQDTTQQSTNPSHYFSIIAGKHYRLQFDIIKTSGSGSVNIRWHQFGTIIYSHTLADGTYHFNETILIPYNLQKYTEYVIFFGFAYGQHVWLDNISFKEKD